MNALGIVLAWTALQVTLFCLAGIGVYLVARRRASGASVLCGTLIVTVSIAIVSVSPWPRWWTVDLRPVARGEESFPLASPRAAETPAARPVEAGGADQAEHEVATFPMPQGLLKSISRMWKQVHDELADPSPAEQLDDRWRWSAWMAAVILSGMGIGLARVLLGMLGLAKLLRETRPVNDPALVCLIEQLRNKLRCRRPIEVREMTRSGSGSPAVVGWRRPIILLPADWRTWSEEARRGILAHEMAHVAHGDFLMWLAAQAAMIVHFYNPLVLWLAGRLRLEQELAADACGAALAGGAKTYANLLAQMALAQDEFRPLWAGRPFFPTRGTLMRRIEMLDHQPIGSRRSPSRIWRAMLLTVLVSVGFAVSGVRGPMRTARADDAAPVTDADTVETPTPNEDSRPTFDRSYLPANAIAVITLKPLKVNESGSLFEPVLSSFPFAANVTFAFSTTGNGVEEVKTILLAAAPGEGGPSKPKDSTEPAVLEIYRMREPYEPSKLRVKIFGEAPDGVTETTCLGYPCFRALSDVSGQFVNYLLVDERTLVILRDRDIPRVLAAGSQSHPSWNDEWLKIADSPLAVACDSAAMAAIDGEPDTRDASDMFIRSMLHEAAFLFAHVECTSGELKISATARCASPEKAMAITNVVQTGAAGLTAALTTVPQIFETSSMPREFQSFDVAGTLVRTLSNLKMNRQEKDVHAEVKFDATFVSEVAEATKALAARQTEEIKAREKQDEQAHVEKLSRLAAAFRQYHADHGHYPAAAVVGPDGKTLHSWRVELLPYLDQQALFDEYKLDEPWDGAHNKPLVEKIPSIYSTSVWTNKGDADYFVVTGKGTLFDADEPGWRETVADAPSETILVLQSNQHVAWTKPVDIETTADHNPTHPFRRGKGFYAAFADGTVKFVTKETDAASVRAMFTKAGGDEVKLR